MKVNLILDPITKQVNGYNQVVYDVYDENNPIIEISNMDSLQLILEGKLYYIDNKLIEQEPDSYYKTLKAKNEEAATFRRLVDNEYKLFMDGFIAGNNIETLRNNTEQNRKSLESIENEIRQLEQEHQLEINTYYNNFYAEMDATIDYKHYISLLLLIRDENEYLEEWLEHYFRIGVDHVYIYDNQSDIPVQEYLHSVNSPYLDRITIVEWKSTENTQQDANNHFLKTYGNETKWIAPVDIDEFVQINDTSMTLEEYLKSNECYGYVHCQWVHFNANGQENKSSELVTKRFTQTADWYDWSSSGKKFIQTNRCGGFIRYNPVLKAYCNGLDNAVNNKDFFQLNHYFTKSYEEWNEKMKRGSCDPNVRRNYRLFFQLNPDMAYLDTEADYVQPYIR